MSLFLTPRQVAERWGCSRRQVQRLCASGELRAMRLGLDAWRIAVADVEAYEQRQTTASTEASNPEPTTREEGRRPVAVDGFTLPADYEPVFPALWPGHAPRTKKAASQRN